MTANLCVIRTMRIALHLSASIKPHLRLSSHCSINKVTVRERAVGSPPYIFLKTISYTTLSENCRFLKERRVGVNRLTQVKSASLEIWADRSAVTHYPEGSKGEMHIYASIFGLLKIAALATSLLPKRFD